ncbi:hypothetical protein L5515_005326 [Caenorhabditis briggsae]|uniref:Uncharacterized protein n=1 Tax=Caenorhabditis briggsae TaxID=6238 RepID=A0AAE9EPV0_CAEBR|nr:hypothetical protein L5515_005326 [Caenorhabditis briggsae]
MDSGKFLPIFSQNFANFIPINLPYFVKKILPKFRLKRKSAVDVQRVDFTLILGFQHSGGIKLRHQICDWGDQIRDRKKLNFRHSQDDAFTTWITQKCQFPT